MASINRIKPGQILYDYHKVRMGNTTMKTEGCWHVKVLEIDLDKNQALCSWNGNPARWYGEKQLSKLKVKKKENKKDKVAEYIESWSKV